MLLQKVVPFLGKNKNKLNKLKIQHLCRYVKKIEPCIWPV